MKRNTISNIALFVVVMFILVMVSTVAFETLNFELWLGGTIVGAITLFVAFIDWLSYMFKNYEVEWW